MDTVVVVVIIIIIIIIITIIIIIIILREKKTYIYEIVRTFCDKWGLWEEPFWRDMKRRVI